MILGIDPGGTTGVAIYRQPSDTTISLEIEGGLTGFVREFPHFREVSHVFIENWRVRGNSHKLSQQQDPYLILGYVLGRCLNHGIPCTVFEPSQHKGLTKVGTKHSLVRTLGYTTKQSGHAEDALSVLVAGRLKTDKGFAQLVSSVLLEEEE